MKDNWVKKIAELINLHLEHVKKYKTERFKEKWIVDVFLNDVILNIEIDEKITVNQNRAYNQPVLDFFKNERQFRTYPEFENFFLSILDGYKEKSKGIYVEYRGEEYLCDIEVTDVDPDRQMGAETLYEITFTDDDGEVISVADVSEYPAGSFTIYQTNKNVRIDENQIINYFQDQTFGEEPSNDWEE